MKTPLKEGNDVPYSADVGDFVDIHEGDRWKCLMCGNCCGDVFSQTWLDLSLIQYIGDPIDGYCKHHDRGNHECHIHSFRPNICRGYPFVLRKSGDSYKIQIHLKCSGVGKGNLIDLFGTGAGLVKLMEDEFDMDFIIRSDGNNGVRLYRIK